MLSLVRAAALFGWTAASTAFAGEIKSRPPLEEIVVLRPFAVNVSPLGTVGVEFTLMGDRADENEAPIDWVVITDVPVGSNGEKAGLRKWDELLLLNDRPIRGLTIAQFATRIRKERQRGELRWKVQRGIARMTFYTIFNGRTKMDDDAVLGEQSAPEPAPAPVADSVEPLRTTIAKATGHETVEKMAPFEVAETRSMGVEVRFILSGADLFHPLDDTIVQARVADVVGDGAGLRKNVLTGDYLVRVNGTPIKGLTIRTLGALVAAEKKKGDLVWDVRREMITTARRMNEKWIKPLPTPVAVNSP